MRNLFTPSGSRGSTALIVCLVAALVGGSVCAFLAGRFHDFALRAQLDELTSAAKLASLFADADVHGRLSTKRTTSAQTRAKQTYRLREAFSHTTGVNNLYTIVKLPAGYFYGFDTATPSEDPTEKRTVLGLLEPIDRLTPGLEQAFKTARPVADPRAHRDRRGVWYSAYAPIIGMDGKVNGVLVVDRSREQVQNILDDVVGTAGNTALAVTAFSLVVLILALRKVKWIPDLVRLRLRAAQSRRFLVGSVLIGTSAVVAVESLTSAPGLIDIGRQRDVIQKEMSGITSAQEALGALLRSEPEWRSKANVAVSQLRFTSIPWIATSLSQLQSDAPLTERQLSGSRLGRSLEREQRVRQDRLQEIHDSEAKLTKKIQTTLLATALLAIVCLLVLRTSTIQDQTIAAAIDHTDRVERDYKRVIDTMPIGLMTWSDGKLILANAEHERVFGHHSPEASLARTLDRVMEADQIGVRECLEQSESEARPVTLHYRVVKPLGDVLYAETRAVPVYDVFGSFRHMLAFTIDVSNAVAAQEEIRKRKVEVEQKNLLLGEAIDALENNLDSFVRAMVRAIEAKDIYTAGHSERVTQYSVWIAEQLGLGDKDIHIIRTGAMVHDIGKIGIPGALLTKPAALTPEERAIVERHPVVGATILKGVPAFEPCLPIIRWHHERLDGTGYPDALSQDAIPLVVRIVSAADAFDAMTSQRSYRRNMPLAQVMEELDKDVAMQRLDGRVVGALKAVVDGRGVLGQGQSLPGETSLAA